MAVNKKTSDAVTTKNNTPAAETKKVETAASVSEGIKTEVKPAEKAEEPKKTPAAKNEKGCETRTESGIGKNGGIVCTV